MFLKIIGRWREALIKKLPKDQATTVLVKTKVRDLTPGVSTSTPVKVSVSPCKEQPVVPLKVSISPDQVSGSRAVTNPLPLPPFRKELTDRERAKLIADEIKKSMFRHTKNTQDERYENVKEYFYKFGRIVRNVLLITMLLNYTYIYVSPAYRQNFNRRNPYQGKVLDAILGPPFPVDLVSEEEFVAEEHAEVVNQIQSSKTSLNMDEAKPKIVQVVATKEN